VACTNWESNRSMREKGGQSNLDGPLHAS
jgi:hypothetical protein